MLSLPLKQYNSLARALAKKGITSESITNQLKASNGFMIVNGTKLKVSLTRLVQNMDTIQPTLIQRIRAEVKIGKIRPEVLERAYEQLKQEQFI